MPTVSELTSKNIGNALTNSQTWSFAKNVKSYDAVGDGLADDTAEIQETIVAAANGMLIIPYGTYMLSAQLVIANPMDIWCFGTLKPSTTGVAGTALISVTSSNVHFYGFGLGMIDGNSKLWCGVLAESSTAMLENVTVSGLRFQNVAIDSTSAYVINIVAYKNALVENNYLYNCGVVGNVSGGGFGIYLAGCIDSTIQNNRLDTVGSSGINTSGCSNTVVTKNKLRKITLFGFKGGYSLSGTVSADVVPTTTTFSVTKNASNTKTYVVGVDFVIILSNTTKTTGTIKTVVDNTTYYTITSTTMDSLPVTTKSIEIFDSGTEYTDNSITYTGDNGFDLNVVKNITIKGNRLRFCGWYQEVGTFVGLHAGIWIGADPQGSVTTLESFNINISGNIIEHTYGGAIIFYASNHIDIVGNTILAHNISNASNVGAISVGFAQYTRSNGLNITGNEIDMLNTGKGFAIYAGFFTDGVISSNGVRSENGIKVNSAVACLVSSNLVDAFSTGAYGLTITDSSATNANSGVQVVGNNIRCTGSGTTAILVTDTAITSWTVTNDNILSAVTNFSSTATAFPTNGQYVNLEGQPIVSTILQADQAHFYKSCTAAAVTTIGKFTADNGGAGLVKFIGHARTAAPNVEAFELLVLGGTGASTIVTFTSLGAPRGAAFLAAGDFTLSNVSDVCSIQYTNNEGVTVVVSGMTTSISR